MLIELPKQFVFAVKRKKKKKKKKKIQLVAE